MSDAITVEMKGLAELEATLEEMPKKIADKGLRSSLKAGAAPIKEGMVTLAPKASGFLSEHFGVRVKMNKDFLGGSAFIGPQGHVDYPEFLSGAYRIVRNAVGKAKKRGKTAVATVARFLEFGTSKMVKKPFMTQSFESHKDAALQAIVDGLTKAVADVAENKQ